MHIDSDLVGGGVTELHESVIAQVVTKPRMTDFPCTAVGSAVALSSPFFMEWVQSMVAT